MSGLQQNFRFQVASSFAGSHRGTVGAIAEKVASQLGRDKIVFDEWYQAEILGPDTSSLLQRFYHEQSLMVVADLSEDYSSTPKPQADARATRDLRFKLNMARDETKRLRLLDVRFEDGDAPDKYAIDRYLDGRIYDAGQCAELILGRHQLLIARLESQSQLVLCP